MLRALISPPTAFFLASDFSGDGSGLFPSRLSEPVPKKIPKVLIVDDERLIADTLAEILNENGFRTSVAYDCEEALDKAMASPPDVVISDVIMPGRTGVDLGIAVRELCPTARIILLSGQAATATLLDSARQYGYEFELLAKPLNPRILLELLSPGGRGGD